MIEIDSAVGHRLQEALRKAVGAERFNLWFRNTRMVGSDDGQLTVGVPNHFVLDWLKMHYLDLIVTCAQEVMGRGVTVRFQVDGALFRQRRAEQAEQEAAFVAGAAHDAIAVPAELTERMTSRMRLENFIVGDCNRLAYTAACEVVRAPGQVFNPLFLHGSVGLGKTHLLQGIALALGASPDGRSCLYLTCEDFTNQYITAMRTRALDGFRRRYRGLDVLIIDDVHFLTNKPATQEEFLHTFNALVDTTGRQVVLASDSHPKTITQLKEQLITRFLSGMVARIEAPDEGTRRRMLEEKAARVGAAFAPGALDFVAARFDGSVRELEGLLTMLLAHAKLDAAGGNGGHLRKNQPVVIRAEVVEEVMARDGRAPRGFTAIADVESVVANYFGISVKELRGASRRRTLSFPRQVAMYLARTRTDASLGDIGLRFGDRDHSTVAAACKRLTRLLEADESIRDLIQRIIERLQRKE